MSEQTTQPQLDQPNTDAEPTLRDAVTAVNQGFTDVAIELGAFRQDMGTIKKDMVIIKQDIVAIRADMVTKSELKQVMAEQETRLVTQDYLDEKLHDLKADITVSLPAAKRILELEPFPVSD